LPSSQVCTTYSPGIVTNMSISRPLLPCSSHRPPTNPYDP
jgi:hypothetical protein